MCGLRWCDIDLDKGYINVNNQAIFDRINKQLILSNVLKTSTAHRKISIPQNILGKYLLALKNEIKPSKNDFVVPSRSGEMSNPRNLSMEFAKRLDKMDDLKQISFHGLRHTHATLLILNGENIKVVSDRLGHKDITTTLNTYTHVMYDNRQNTASLLDNLFSN